ncbi:DUF3696 domain-containing protein [Nocardia sp. SYP-A9097]|uniref:DUF3696 domain-containing protein n=1 Tax=Nocardia sp. SYP-A9097 TaxID=2663237 RepID=UPI00129A2277|nr:DUF3696 domain-containing protein [Nocardia sp. SYP-A9097]MRH92569.1 DUF3696 domain-containing protein [Nocardia sp. SYP-A9097]
MIREIRLLNFKGFADQTVPLGQFTLLTGLNSSGKSTVLQAFALTRQSAETGRIFGSPSNPYCGFTLNGEMVELGTGRDLRHESWIANGEITLDFQCEDPTTGKEFRFRWSAGYDADEDFLKFESMPTMQEWLSNPRPNFLTSSLFQYLRADRINPAVSYPRSSRSRQGFLGARGEYTADVLRQHQDDPVSPEVRHPAAVSDQLLRQTEAWLGHLCPGINLTATGIDGTDAVRIAYSHGTGGLTSSNQYRPTNVGFGLTYVLPIIVACLTAKPGALILLENPEAHLHPRGQSALAELVVRAAKTGAQVIVESHSDHILNGVRIAVKKNLIQRDQLKLHYFHSGSTAGHAFQTIEVGPAGTIAQWPDGFFDEWDRALDELID